MYMQAQTLINYIKNPHLMDKESVPQLQKLVHDFPYFQAGHILLSLAAKKWDANVYQQTLKKTAIVISNRAHLFNLINGMEEVTSVIDSKVEEQEEIEKVTQEVFANDNTQTELEALKTTIEDIKHELDILKATELATENVKEESNIEPIISKEETILVENNFGEVIDEKKVVETERNEKNKDEPLEKEIEKALVNAFVEKEIIKTPELHHPELIKKQPENFTDWLQLLKKNNGQSSEDIKEQVAKETRKQQPVLKTNQQLEAEQSEAELKKQKQKALIDKIIEINPGAIKNKEEKKFFVPITQAKESLIENEHLVTETLAKIYAMQGNVNKAVRAYEILSLKFPQKSVYFASLIKKLKENQ
ncbi:MAG: hypothetical protein SFY56_02645 [Bacteroidota bacterium]|nr:hypothetical protein [Bacteroidota bacterium]